MPRCRRGVALAPGSQAVASERRPAPRRAAAARAHLAAEAAAYDPCAGFQVLRDQALELVDPWQVLVGAVVAAADDERVVIGSGLRRSRKVAGGAAEYGELVTGALERAAPELRRRGGRARWVTLAAAPRDGGGERRSGAPGASELRGCGTLPNALSASPLLTASVMSFHFSASSHSNTATRHI